jgi:hypothetical protein
MKKLNLFLAICCVLVVALMRAQANGSPDVPEIQGVVTRSGSSEKLAGVKITFLGLRGEQMVQISSATSWNDGTYYRRDEAFFEFADKPIVVRATLAGYKEWSKAVTLDSTPEIVNIELTPAAQ